MFLGDVITNKKLYLKIRNELGNKYCIGLHNSARFKWYEKVKFDENYNINNEYVDEEFIISNILKKGLYIPDRCVGIKSTVTILDKITIDCFNYSYYQYLGDDKCYVIIVAIPKCIYVNNKKYFIQNMISEISVTNYLLFNTLLPKEFIYGYYIKNVEYHEKMLGNDDSFFECVFNKNLEFYSNSDFYGYMDDIKREEFWINYFEDNSIDISLLCSSDGLCKCRRKNK